MITDLRACDLCEAAYTASAKWSRLDVHATLTEEDGLSIVAFRGSASLIDWFRDFQAIPHLPVKQQQIGLVHEGFFIDVMQVAPAIQEDLAGKEVVLAGHSKGAAEAQLLAALMVAAGTPPVQLVTFGAPRCGFGRLQETMHGLPGSDFVNAPDPVPPLPIPYLHPRPTTQLGVKAWLPRIEDHFLVNYRTALISPKT